MKIRSVAWLLLLSVALPVWAQDDSLQPDPVVQQMQLQQREAQVQREIQESNAPDNIQAQIQAQQQALQRQEMLQAQQEQADAERDQANEMWQEQMNQPDSYGDSLGGAAAEGAAEIAGALIQRHEEEQVQQAQVAALEQAMSVTQAIQDQLNAVNAEKDELDAKYKALLNDTVVCWRALSTARGTPPVFPKQETPMAVLADFTRQWNAELGNPSNSVKQRAVLTALTPAYSADAGH